jgi:hypothetical protein
MCEFFASDEEDYAAIFVVDAGKVLVSQIE